MINNTWHENSKKITVQKITALSFLSAILIIVKFTFGFIPGIEFVTSLIIIYGMLLPYKDSILLVCVFNLVVLIMYGFGPWWLVYWPIFLTDVSIGRVLRRWFKNKFVLAFFAFILGFSVLVWYFFSNVFWFGWAFAYTSLFSALPINLIEGLSNFAFCILVAPVLVKTLNKFLPNIWGNKFDFEFKKVKRRKLNFFSSVTMIFLSISGIGLFFGFNSTFLNVSQVVSNQVNAGNYTLLKIPINEKPITNKNSLSLVKDNNHSSSGNLLSNSSLFYLYHLMNNTQSAIVVILKGKTYIRLNDDSMGKVAEKYIIKNKDNDQWYMAGTQNAQYGLFITSFIDTLNPDNSFTAQIPKYFAIYINKFKNENNSLYHLRLYSNVGISSLYLNSPREIVTITLTSE